ncbi:MAG: methylmalonate-semialdehyde dehydrogenase (CoA acylating) [Actinobacteria bacterium]|nr:MAG: methylmalonate-semialdehyde dehydrogenase (CoA acylating) [Actinomycetota bacterium]
MAMLEEPKSDYGTLRNYVNGEWTESTSDSFEHVVDPATGKVIAQVPNSSQEDVDKAVSAAAEAFGDWKRTSVVQRTRPFFRLKQLLEDHKEDLARTLVQEMGKVIKEARGEMLRAIEEIEATCAVPTTTRGYHQENIGPNLNLRVTYIPRGVFFMVPSFNFPAMVPLEYYPYAVAAGCTFVNKPSPQVPITQTRIFELIDECGFPPGVLNLVHGGRDVVHNLMEHPGTEGFSFVGSSKVGAELYAKAASLGKRGQAATGAKNHFVVMPDADFEKAADAAMSAFFGAGGQRCLAGAVLVPVGEAYEPMRDLLVEKASQWRLGHGLDETSDLGPVVSRSARDRIVTMVDRAIGEGAEPLLDGRDVNVAEWPEGAFVGPTILDGVTPDMEIAREEVFGPVAAISAVDTMDDAISLIDRSRYGHSAVIFTRSGASGREFESRVPVGNIGVNVGVPATQSWATLGGLKESAYGSLHGRAESVLFYTDRKIVAERWD